MATPAVRRGVAGRAADATMNHCLVRGLVILCGALLLLTSCDRPARTSSWQGYIEGEFIHVASPLAGRLDRLAVTRGARVEAGAELFSLENDSERAAQREAAQRLREATARLEDLRKGQRPSEIAALEARRAHSRALAELSRLQLVRAASLRATDAMAEEELDRARLNHEANTNLVAELEAQLVTARLGARADLVAAAEADVAAARAALDRADWNVRQKAQKAPVAALVYDHLYREGEFVPAGTPVISLLPPENIRVRFFVPEAEVASLKAGDPVSASVTRRASALPARISSVSPRPEFTPPVLYNRENRAKLVFMVEAVPLDPAAAKDLHPGQPVDVRRQ